MTAKNKSATEFSICHQICTVNPEFIVDAHYDATFAAVLRRADLCVPDGIGVLWAARWQGFTLRERVTGSDGIFRFCQRAAERSWSIFLLGAAPGIAEKVAAKLKNRYPGLKVVGSYSGNPNAEEWSTIHQQLSEVRPDLLLVAFGHPKQDRWIDQHRHELPATVAIGVGGAFDFVVGIQQRAPLLWQRFGLEWLYRLWCEPWRWRRMLKLPLFVGLVLWEKLQVASCK